MKAIISGYFQQFSEYYKETILRRLFVGLIVGSGIWISILIITVLITIISDENIWLRTLVNDLPGLGGILALLISLQIWGLLPQPMDSNEEQVSTQDTDIIEVTDETSGDIPDADLSETEASEQE